jgi:hypothetical protein
MSFWQNYYRPETVEEALAHLRTYGKEPASSAAAPTSCWRCSRGASRRRWR